MICSAYSRKAAVGRKCDLHPGQKCFWTVVVAHLINQSLLTASAVTLPENFYVLLSRTPHLLIFEAGYRFIQNNPCINKHFKVRVPSALHRKQHIKVEREPLNIYNSRWPYFEALTESTFTCFISDCSINWSFWTTRSWFLTTALICFWLYLITGCRNHDYTLLACQFSSVPDVYIKRIPWETCEMRPGTSYISEIVSPCMGTSRYHFLVERPLETSLALELHYFEFTCLLLLPEERTYK